MVIDTILHARLPQWGSFDNAQDDTVVLCTEDALFSFEGTTSHEFDALRSTRRRSPISNATARAAARSLKTV
jgi:hypothetical protein